MDSNCGDDTISSNIVVEQNNNAESNKKRGKHRFRSRKQKRLENQKRKTEGVTRKDDRDTRPRVGYTAIVKSNVNFENFYKAQKIIDTEDEWQLFMSTLQKSLPSDFRISSFCAGQTEKMRDIIENDLIKLSADLKQNQNDDDYTKNETTVEKELAIAPIPWYPNNLAWTINLSKIEIRKSATLQKLHKFLISETETGDISRQEAVSMIPPLLLNVQPGHSVLDMCAAPGSKTAQIIEMLHQQSYNDFVIGDVDNLVGKTPLNGLVVANDVDNKRCYMLVHQSNRLHSPCVVVTNHDASTMPTFYTANNDDRKVLKFDRVLADVPCSGDGTMRKNYDVWPKWNTANSNNFHSLQLKIAKRGLELLAKDGLMAYSTCSLNPAENEAVIATLLNSAPGSLELVNAAAALPELKCRPGLEHWVVMSRDNQVHNSFAEVPENLQHQIRESLFPPSNAAELKLRYCIRVLPHYQNTGGFFIALLRKKCDKMPWEEDEKSDAVSAVSESKPVEGSGNDSGKSVNNRGRGGRRKFAGHREDPFYFLAENDSEWSNIKQYYKLPNSFSYKQLAHRCTTGKRRNLYFLTEMAANFISSNPHVKIITGGSRVFNRVDVNDLKCCYRITQEGIPSLFPYFMSKLFEYLPDENNIINSQGGENSKPNKAHFNIVPLEREYFVRLLKQVCIKMEAFESEPALQRKIKALTHGCCIVYAQLNRPPPNETSSYILPICAWRGRNSLRAYVARNERAHLLRLCGEEPIFEPEVKEVKGDETKIVNKTNEDEDVEAEPTPKRCKLNVDDDENIDD